MTVKTDRPKLNWYKSAVLGPYKAGRNRQCRDPITVQGIQSVIRLQDALCGLERQHHYARMSELIPIHKLLAFLLTVIQYEDR